MKLIQSITLSLWIVGILSTSSVNAANGYTTVRSTLWATSASEEKDLAEKAKELRDTLNQHYGATKIKLSQKLDSWHYRYQEWEESGADKGEEKYQELSSSFSELREEVKAIEEEGQKAVTQSWAQSLLYYENLINELEESDEVSKDQVQDWKSSLEELKQRYVKLQQLSREDWKEKRDSYQEDLERLVSEVDFEADQMASRSEDWASRLNRSQKEARENVIAFYERNLYRLKSAYEDGKDEWGDQEEEFKKSFHENREKVQDKLADLRDAGEEKWDDSLDVLQSGWSEFKEKSQELGEKAKELWNRIW